jgi:hypothetical protein
VIDTVKRRAGKVPKGEQPAAALAQLAGQLGTAGLRALVLELCLSRGAYFVMSSEKYPRDLARAIEDLRDRRGSHREGRDRGARREARGSPRARQVERHVAPFLARPAVPSLSRQAEHAPGALPRERLSIPVAGGTHRLPADVRRRGAASQERGGGDGHEEFPDPERQ